MPPSKYSSGKPRQFCDKCKAARIRASNGRYYVPRVRRYKCEDCGKKGTKVGGGALPKWCRRCAMNHYGRQMRYRKRNLEAVREQARAAMRERRGSQAGSCRRCGVRVGGQNRKCEACLVTDHREYMRVANMEARRR